MKISDSFIEYGNKSDKNQKDVIDNKLFEYHFWIIE